MRGLARGETGNPLPVIEIDGSAGEGGGQVVRTAVSLAAVTGRAVDVSAVRARRDRPGLQPQHLAAVRAAAAICDAATTGAEVGSARLRFEPTRPPRGGDYTFDIGTAGAATLVVQTALIPLLRAGAPSSIEVIGGTHQPMSPTADYLERVYAPALRSFGVGVDVEYGPAGHYPRGGGHIRAVVEPGPLRAVDLSERGQRLSLTALVVTNRLRPDVAERGAATVAALVPAADVRTLTPGAFSPGAAVTLVASHDGGHAGVSSIGRPGLPMEAVATDACERFLAWEASGAACDERLSDQLVLPAALATGESRWTTPRITRHLETALAVVEAFIPIRVRTDGPRVSVRAA